MTRNSDSWIFASIVGMERRALAAGSDADEVQESAGQVYAIIARRMSFPTNSQSGEKSWSSNCRAFKPKAPLRRSKRSALSRFAGSSSGEVRLKTLSQLLTYVLALHLML